MATESIETVIDLDGKNLPEDSSPQEDDFEVVVKDDTPEQDRNRPQRQPGTKSAIPEDDEIGQYTKGVQDRLKQMKWEYHEERRAKEAWQREHEAAVAFARKVFEENQLLRKNLSAGHKAMIDTAKVSAESEIKALRDSLKVALETGDTEKAADLQTKIASVAARAEAQNHMSPVTFEEQEMPKQFTQQAPQQQAPKVTPAMRSWMDENPWFNQNKRMTAFAFGVHEELLEKGIPPESPRYFSEINKAVREAFSNYFETDPQDEGRAPPERRPRGTNVSGVNRTSSVRSRTRVELTLSEKAVAKRLGLTEKQYAAEKLRLENLDG